MNIFILRHGETEYRQGNRAISLDEANDIKDEAKPVLRASARDMHQRTSDLLRIISSPYGRTLASAKEIFDELKGANAKIMDIAVDDRLREVEGLDYEFFMGLVEGPKICVNGNIYDIGKKLTNPQNLSPVRFFRTDMIHSPDYLKLMPVEIAERIGNIESYKSIRTRLENTVRSLDQSSILVTHEGGTGYYVYIYTKDPEAFLQKGKFIELHKEKDVYVPIYMNR